MSTTNEKPRIARMDKSEDGNSITFTQNTGVSITFDLTDREDRKAAANLLWMWLQEVPA
ncbi:MAG TPA: hypothetical protein VFK31_09560 [Rhodanobacteraceae bacterium]|nr:hypothetical protein [Rhodanobacteraceae bacterium]